MSLSTALLRSFLMSKSIQGYAIEIYLDDLLSDFYSSNLEVFVVVLSLCDFCSPLHSRDLDSNGEFKKSHYHILFSPEIDLVTLKVALGKFQREDGSLWVNPHIERIYNYDIYYRYLTHSDAKSMLNPYKANYRNCRLLFRNPRAHIPLPPVDYQRQLRELYLKECDGLSYSDFVSYIDLNYPDVTSIKEFYLPTFTNWVSDRYKHFLDDVAISNKCDLQTAKAIHYKKKCDDLLKDFLNGSL